jgi:integrase
MRLHQRLHGFHATSSPRERLVTMKFSDKQIINLKPTAKQYYKRESEGFAVRVLPSGVKTWLFIYTISGRRRQMNLGDYPDITLAKARERLIDARQALKDGKDPQEVGFEWHKNPEREKKEADKQLEADRRNPTVRQLAGEYMERHAKIQKRQSSWVEDERLLNVNVLPAWGDRKANEIRKRDCVLLLESVMDRPALCHNVLKLTRKMFNFAVERDILEFTPFTGVKAPVQITHRERTLSESEIRALWTTELPKASMTDEVKRILKLVLVTGQRSGEVAGVHAREVDGNWWTIPPERAKNKAAHRVYLTSTALDLLGESENYFFPSPKNGRVDENGVIYCSHIDENAVAYAIRRNLKDYQPRRAIKGETISMVKVKEEKKMEMQHFTPHDLRRTAATFMAGLRFPDETIDAVLGHKKQGVIKVYNQHKYDLEKQKALEAWERKLNRIITGATGKVIPISRAI